MERQFNFYKNDYPDVGDIVTVKIKEVEDILYVVELLEYPGLIGNMMMSEVTRRRTHKVPKQLRVGKRDVVEITAVDKIKGYIDVSKKSIDAEETKEAIDKYEKAKVVNSIIRKCGGDIDNILQTIVWPLYEEYEHAYTAFNLALAKPEILGDTTIIGSSSELLLNEVKKRLTKKIDNHIGTVRLVCMRDGIDGIKSCLGEAKNKFRVRITYEGDSKYRIVAYSTFPDGTFDLEPEKTFELCKKFITERIKDFGGMVVEKKQLEVPSAIPEED